MVGWYNMKSKWNDDEEVEVRFVSSSNDSKTFHL